MNEAEARGGGGDAQRRAFLRPGPGPGVGHAPGRRGPTWPRSRPCTACCGNGPRSENAGPRPGGPALVKPELVATAPNEVWSWDITKLAGPYKWTWYPALHHPRRLQPLRRGVAGGVPGVGHLGRAAHRRCHLPPRRRPTASSPCTPTGAVVHDVEDRQPAALPTSGVLQSHSRPHVSPTTTPTPRPSSRRSSTRPRFPKRFANIDGGPGVLRPGSSTTTTTSTGTRASGSTPRPTSTSGWPRSSGRSARASSTPPTPP